MNEEVLELINRRERQILVHSYLYYKLDMSIIDDHTFDRWSRELADLLVQYPEEAAASVYAKGFKDFDGSSGFDLPFSNPEVMTVGDRLLRYHETKRKAATR